MATQSTFLSWMTFAPAIGVGAIALLLLLRPLLGLTKSFVDNGARAIALLASAVPLVMTTHLWAWFDSSNPGMQFEHHLPWITAFNIEYYLGRRRLIGDDGASHRPHLIYRGHCIDALGRRRGRPRAA